MTTLPAMIPDPQRLAVFSFTGTDRVLAWAIAEATQRADEWLATHQWIDAAGRSVYNVHTSAAMDGDTHVFTVFLLGPSGEVVRP